MKATQLIRKRIEYPSDAFAEYVLWRLPRPIKACSHCYKYRRAYVVHGVCVVRYDNEAGKGDQRHYDKRQCRYVFSNPEQLIAAFLADIARWNSEHAND